MKAIFISVELQEKIRSMVQAGWYLKEIAEECNLKVCTLSKAIKELDIHVQKGFKQRQCLYLNAYEKEIIDGCLLGDGCIIRSTNQRGSFILTSKHESYPLLLQSKLNFEAKVSRVEVKSKYYWHFNSISDPTFLDLRNKWYPNGEKIVPKNLVLSPTACLHWYYGDGHLHNKDRNAISLHTNGFQEEDVEFLEGLLSDLNLSVLIGKDYHIKKKEITSGLFIVVRNESVNDFLNYIGHSEIEEFNYKWAVNPNRKSKKTAVRVTFDKVIYKFSSITKAAEFIKISPSYLGALLNRNILNYKDYNFQTLHVRNTEIS